MTRADNKETAWREVEAMTVFDSEKAGHSYFQATPVNGGTPCLFRAVYFVTRENGHWVYRLQPGTLAMLNQGSQSSL